MGALNYFEPQLLDTFSEVPRVDLQALHQAVIFFQDLECFHRGNSYRWGEGIGKCVRPRFLAEERDQVFAACNISTRGAAHCFAERATENIDLTMYAQILRGSSA